MSTATLAALQLLVPSGPVELRVLADRMIVERFDDRRKIAPWIIGHETLLPRGSYVVMNPFDPMAITGAAVTDAAVTSRRWLLVDVDPVREADSNSSKEELELSVSTARAIEEYLFGRGWPEPVRALSGNGAHLLYRIQLPNDPAAKAIVDGVLRHLSAEFSSAGAHVDTTVSNAARITKLYGTKSRKGPHSDERPQRVSKITRIPDPLVVVSRELLDAVAVFAPALSAPASRPQSFAPGESAYDIGDVLARVVVRETYAKDGSTFYSITCPWEFEHSTKVEDRGTVIIQDPAGAIAFKCLHAHCVDRNWKSLRSHLAIDTKAWKERERRKVERVVAPASAAPVSAGAREPGSDDGEERAPSKRVTIAESARRMDTINRMDQYARTGAMPGAITTGMARLNGMLLGGFRPGKFYLLGGETGRGKTTLLLQWAIKAAEALPDSIIGIVSPEMDEESLTERVLSARTGFGVVDYRQRAQRVRELWGTCHVPQNLRASFDPEDLHLFVSEEKPRVLIIDYAQQAVSYESERRHTALAQLGADCLRIAKSMQIPVILGTQVNVNEDRDFTVRETRILEHQADAVIYIDIVYDKNTDAEGNRILKSAHLLIAKNRHGYAGRIPIDWQASLFRFEERA